MKRVFEEISDDEWENHSFKPSRVLDNKNPKPTPPPPPPPIESFSFNSSSKTKLSSDCLDLEDADDDFEEFRPANRSSRRFVIDDDESDDERLPEVVEVKSTTEDEEDEDEDEVEEEVGLDEDDVVGKALQKCAKISAELRKDLYGSSMAACDGYAEVEASSVRIVTQVPALWLW